MNEARCFLPFRFLQVSIWSLLLIAAGVHGTEGDLQYDTSPTSIPTCQRSSIVCGSTMTPSGETLQLVPKRVRPTLRGFKANRLEELNVGVDQMVWTCAQPACLSSPCQTNHSCVETEDGFKCVCLNGIFDDRCQVYPINCAHLKALGSTEDGRYVIDPDGAEGSLTGPVEVQCKMATGSTIISHDTTLTTGSNFPVNEYVTYDLPSETTVRALIDSSRSCRQMVFLDCRHYRIFSSDGSEQRAWWTSSQGRNMTNWGGAPTGHRGCGCSVDNTCPVGLCNCDEFLPRWNIDSGYLTDMDQLPVIRLHIAPRLNDTQEYISIWLDPLECEGQRNI